MPKYDPLEGLSLADIIPQLKQLTISDCTIARNFLSERIEILNRERLHPEKRIEDLQLSKRALIILKRNKLLTVKDVLDFKRENLLQSDGLGKKTYNEICMCFDGKILTPFRR